MSTRWDIFRWAVKRAVEDVNADELDLSVLIALWQEVSERSGFSGVVVDGKK